jgi:hypothetical protein
MDFCVNRFLLLFCAVAITQHRLFFVPLFAHHVIIIAKRAIMVNQKTPLFWAVFRCKINDLALLCLRSAGKVAENARRLL